MQLVCGIILVVHRHALHYLSISSCDVGADAGGDEGDRRPGRSKWDMPAPVHRSTSGSGFFPRDSPALPPPPRGHRQVPSSVTKSNIAGLLIRRPSHLPSLSLRCIQMQALHCLRYVPNRGAGKAHAFLHMLSCTCLPAHAFLLWCGLPLERGIKFASSKSGRVNHASIPLQHANMHDDRSMLKVLMPLITTSTRIQVFL